MKFLKTDMDAYGTHIHDVLFISVWRYIHMRLWKLEVLFVLAVIAISLTRLPYINLVFGISTAVFCILIMAIFVLQIKYLHVLFMVMALFVCALFLTLFGNEVLAEVVGNYIYFFLWIVVFQSIHALWKRQ